MADIRPKNEERLIRFLDPGIRSQHTASRDILKPLHSTGILISLDITSISTGGMRLFFQCRDNQDNYLDVFRGAGVSSVGTYQYLISPDAVTWPDLTEIFVSPVPTVLRAQIRHTVPGNDFNYSVHGQFI